MPKMPLRPWEKPTRTLSLRLGLNMTKNKAGLPQPLGMNIGWAPFENKLPKIKEYGTDYTKGDPISALVSRWEQMGKPKAVNVYRYDEQSFHESHAFDEGMTLEEHKALCLEIQREMAALGVTVHFDWVYATSKKITSK